jgi:uncharacterized membrane protein (Fun14 family)
VAISPGAGISGGQLKDILLVAKIKTTTATTTTTTKRQQQPKGGGNRKMSGIESSIMPFVSTVGFGGIAGFLVGFAIKRIMKILAVIAGVFFAALLYLESQHIVNVNWDKLQTISNGVLSTIATTTNASATGGGVGNGPIQSILGNNSTAAADAILPITSTISNLGIPLTGSTAMGFTIGILKG